MAQCMRTTLNPPKTPFNSTQNLTQDPLFPSIYSFGAKPKSRKYPKISLSVMSSQSQQKNPPFDALLDSGRKEEVFVAIKDSVHNCLSETNLQLTVPGLKSKTRGKVRDIYDSGDYLVLVTTDRQSAFDRILASIPFKGQVLNETSLWWFNRTQHITPNAVLSVPDKNVVIAKKCSVFPVEFVVRGFVTGSTDTSLWTVYKNGVRNYCGNVLPNGLVKNQKLTANILTPTTKAEDHDVPVTPDEIIERGLMTRADFDEAREKYPNTVAKEKTVYHLFFLSLLCSSLRLLLGFSLSRLTLAMDLMLHSSTFLLPTIPQDHLPSLTYALVVLNQKLPRFTPLLWKHAQLRLCADGGANRVYDEMPLLFPHEDASDVRRRYKPNVIKGDMDSIRTEVLDFYTNLGTEIIDKSHDQDTTDLHKCITYIHDFGPDLDKSNLCILVAGALGGRFDHEIGNLNVLCRFSSLRIVLLSDDSLIYLLSRTHHHEIHIQTSVEGPHCGLIPIGMPSGGSTTTGLQWDLNNTEMRFGGLISTSNIVTGEKVRVQSDSDLLWTISIKKS